MDKCGTNSSVQRGISAVRLWDRKILGQKTVRTEEGEDRRLLGQKTAEAGAPVSKVLLCPACEAANCGVPADNDAPAAGYFCWTRGFFGGATCRAGRRVDR